MAYMLLIIEPRGQRQTRTPEQGEQAYAEMVRFREGLRERGVLIAGESLRNDTEGLRLQIRDGASQLRDGPFAEAREMIGGFFLLDCDSREQALAIAHECPAAQWCSIEIREVAPCCA